MEHRKRLVVAVLLVIAWLSQVVYFYPLPTEAIDKSAAVFQDLANKNQGTLGTMKEEGRTKTDATTAAADVKAELWRKWLEQLAIVVVGLVSAGMALFAIRFWQPVALIAALLYLVGWYIDSGMTTSMSLMRSYEVKWAFANSLGTVGSFVHRDVVLPLFYLATTILLVVDIVRSGRMSGENRFGVN